MTYINNIINDDHLYKFYSNYNKVFSGLKTVRDGYKLLEMLKISNKDRNLLLSIIDNRKYGQQLDFESMIDVIRDLNLCKYREEAYNKISQIMKMTSEVVQIKTMTRIANSKPLMPIYLNIKDVRDTRLDMIVKKCPHCGVECSMNNTTEYNICGFDSNGYDWIGCGKDWCVKCNKLLCKSWDNEQLFISGNQIHDNTCCRKHAQTNNKKYPEDYCQCKNSHIRRDIESIYNLK